MMVKPAPRLATILWRWLGRLAMPIGEALSAAAGAILHTWRGYGLGVLGDNGGEEKPARGRGRRWQLQQWEQKTETGGRYSQVAVGAAQAKQSGGSNLLSLNFQGIEGVEAVVSPNFPHLRIGQGLGAADWARGSSWLIGLSGLVRPTGGYRAQEQRGARQEQKAGGLLFSATCAKVK